MPTFGKTSIGAGSWEENYWNHKFACRFQALENGVITDVSAYLWAWSATEVFLCVYSDDNGVPGSLLGYGSVTVDAAWDWYTASGLNIPIEAGKYYWLAVNHGTINTYAKVDDGVANQFIVQDDWADAPPPDESFGSGTFYDYELSIYATYTPTGPRLLTIDINPKTVSLHLGESVNIKATVSGGTPPYSVEWIDASTQNVIGAGDTYTFVGKSTGTFTIYARVTDSAGSSAESQIATITVSEAPTYEVFDNCDAIDNWAKTEGNLTLAVDTIDKVEGAGSLKGTFIEGGMFYKRPATGFWDFTAKPLMKVKIKINKSPPAGCDLRFELVTGEEGNPWAWNIFTYEIKDKLKSGQWVEVPIDLRLPSSGPEGKLPALNYVAQLGFTCWVPAAPPLTINWDLITIEEGPALPLQGIINPRMGYLIVGSTETFKVTVMGGNAPYSYTWYVDGVLQPETSNTFTFTSNKTGTYTINCIVTDASGTQITLTATATVTEKPPEFPPSIDIFKSHINGVFIQPGWYLDIDWETVAKTCKDYGANTIVIQDEPGYLWDEVANTPVYHSDLATAVNTFKKYGFNVHVLIILGLYGPEGYNAVTSEGAYDWLCFTKASEKNFFDKLARHLVAAYNIDGVMFDYIRWDFRTDMCLCTSCKSKFIKDTGITNVNWPVDVLEGGRYFQEFIKWRIKPVTEAVEVMTKAIKSVRPEVLVSAAVFSPYADANWYVYGIGQHTADWIDRGLLDFVCPIMGTRTLYGTDSVDERCRDILNQFVGQAEGKVPLVPFTLYSTTTEPRPVDNFIDALKIMKRYGVDGWILWRYGGPGFPHPDHIDIRPYLTAINAEGLLPSPWAIQNFNIALSEDKTQATIYWTTTIPTKSRIEYSDTPIFIANPKSDEAYGRGWLVYKDIDYVGGTIIEDAEFKTVHTFTIPVTSSTEFRIQSIDESGVTVTSLVLPIPAAAPPTHVLTIMARAGGITNPSPGSYTLPEGTQQTVTAIPDANYRFVNWLLDGVSRTENPITVTMDKDHTLEAVFEYVPPPPLTATIKGTITDETTGLPVAGATVTCDGYADVTEVDGSYIFENIPAQRYTLKVTKTGYREETFSVDASAGGTFTVDISISPITHTLTIIARAGGTTNPSPGTYTIVEGQRQQVTAIPSANYKFAYWLLDGVTRTENPITVTMDTDHILEAVFEYVPPPPLTATISGIVKNPAGNPIAGAVVTCDGYADVTETDGSYIIADIPAKPYTLTITKEGYQTQTIPVDLSAGGTFTQDITLTPKPTPKPPPTVVGPLGFWNFPILTWIIEFIRRIRSK